MPSFMSSQPDLLTHGPVVDIAITVSSFAAAVMKKEGNPNPPSIDVRAMIDTGASGSAIQFGLAARLGVHPISTRPIHTASAANIIANEYAVRFLLPNDLLVETTAFEATLEEQNIEALIGRDVLAEGVFVYMGYSNTFSFSV